MQSITVDQDGQTKNDAVEDSSTALLMIYSLKKQSDVYV
jgi:hypothetical protein